MGEMPELDLGSMCVGGTIKLLILAAFFAWGGWVAKRQGNRPFWRRVAWTSWIAFALEIAGIAIGVVFLIQAFGAVAYVPAENRAQALSDNIGHAMTASAVFLVPAYALYLFALVTFAIGSFRKPAPA